MRSAETMARRWAIALMACMTPASMSKDNWAANRAARIIRSGSSSKLCSGVTGVRKRPWARSRSPPNGSTNSRRGNRTAIALTVKSRRERSPSRESPYATTGLREWLAYSSVR